MSVAFDAGRTTIQLCLAWLLPRCPFNVPIPGTTSIAHLDENLGALKLDLPADMLAAVDAIFPWQAIAGARYTAAAQSQIDTETWPGEPLA